MLDWRRPLKPPPPIRGVGGKARARARATPVAEFQVGRSLFGWVVLLVSVATVLVVLAGITLGDSDSDWNTSRESRTTIAVATGLQLTSTTVQRLVLVNADLRNAQWTDVHLGSVDLSNSSLANSTLRRVNLDSAHLAGTDLTNAILVDASLTGACMHNASLRNADLSGARLDGADLRGADLTEAKTSARTSFARVEYDSRTLWPRRSKPADAPEKPFDTHAC